ncbi:MAG TPA: PEP-CTERM sorting domain-containing protein [Gemmataceae bacterium]|nr:PEP-CTERM sorting domain-containing protein [Gemmataceae bacterium]
MVKRFGTVAVLLAGLAFSNAQAAQVVDLTAPGSSATVNGALLFQANPQPTGTGFIDSFVRIESNSSPPKSITQGYNTDFRPVQFDEKKDAQYTHSLNLSNLQPVTLNGTSYYQFHLDINQEGNDPLLSVDEIQIFVENSPNLTGAVFNGVGTITKWNGGSVNANLVYNLDAGGNKFVKLDYNLNSGSGSGDMFLFVPTALFTGGQYVYLYSKFGGDKDSKGKRFDNNGGYEEWAAVVKNVPPPPPQPPGPAAAPEPASITLALLGLGGLGIVKWRRRSPKAAA